MRMQAFIFCLLCLLLSGACSDKQVRPEVEREAPTPGKEVINISDPQGPIPAPSIPSDLAAASKASATPISTAKGEPVTYTVELSVAKGPSAAPGDPDGGKDESSAPYLATFQKISVLYKLKDSPPETLIGLEQRLAVALDEARDVMNSQGYYLGRASGKVEKAPSTSENGAAPKAVVKIRFFPGQQYTVGKTTVSFTLPPGVTLPEQAESPGAAKRQLPRSLADVGLEPGAPAVADAVLAAVDRVQERFLDNGFPFASIASTRYIVDHAGKVLEAEVTVTPGAYVLMGEIERHGAEGVREKYVQNLKAWRTGRPWSNSRVEAYREGLRQSGLFQSIDITPSEIENPDGTRTVVTKLESAPERTVGGALKYHSDFGPGVQAFWEHRNLTGRGDRLRLEAPVWTDMQEVTATYRVPFFLRRDQDFIASGGFLHQDTDAYNITSAAGAAGVERRLSRNWSVSVQGSAQGGNIKEPDEPRRDYIMYGIPLGLTYNTARNPLDATKGAIVSLNVAPYTGKYDGEFSIVRSRLEGRTYIPLKGEDEVVLALRGVLGLISGEKSAKVPPSVRFYSGGGGSVRGYEYQSLGPRNSDKKPLGGGSLMEVSAETRWKLSQEWGLVAFVDGGTAYEDEFSGVGDTTIRWGAGVGVRYYTAIGPVRVDIATPLNPRNDDDSMQFYISIGQSF